MGLECKNAPIDVHFLNLSFAYNKYHQKRVDIHKFCTCYKLNQTKHNRPNKVYASKLTHINKRALRPD